MPLPTRILTVLEVHEAFGDCADDLACEGYMGHGAWENACCQARSVRLNCFHGCSEPVGLLEVYQWGSYALSRLPDVE